MLDYKERPKISRLKLVDFYSPFLLLAAGTTLSLFVFIAENFRRIKKGFARLIANVSLVDFVFY